MSDIAHLEQFSGRVCAAGRALLDWSQERLSAESGVARKTISDFELALRHPQARTKRDLLRAFDGHGVKFAVEGGLITLQLACPKIGAPTAAALQAR